MITVTLGASVLFCTLYADNNIFVSIKRLALLSVIWPVAYIDFKTYRIPNTFILFGLGCRAALLPFELLFYDQFFTALLSEVIAAGALLLACILCALCLKGSIGFGDMKLFIVMGLLLGLDGIWSAVFTSLLISFVIAAFLAGMAGALYGLNYSNTVATKFNFNTSINILIFVVLGGMGNILGSVISATVLYILPEAMRGLEDYRMILYAVVLIVVMLGTWSPKVKEFLSMAGLRVKSMLRRKEVGKHE